MPSGTRAKRQPASARSPTTSECTNGPVGGRRAAARAGRGSRSSPSAAGCSGSSRTTSTSPIRSSLDLEAGPAAEVGRPAIGPAEVDRERVGAAEQRAEPGHGRIGRGATRGTGSRRRRCRAPAAAPPTRRASQSGCGISLSASSSSTSSPVAASRPSARASSSLRSGLSITRAPWAAAISRVRSLGAAVDAEDVERARIALGARGWRARRRASPRSRRSARSPSPTGPRACAVVPAALIRALRSPAAGPTGGSTRSSGLGLSRSNSSLPTEQQRRGRDLHGDDLVRIAVQEGEQDQLARRSPPPSTVP